MLQAQPKGRNLVSIIDTGRLALGTCLIENRLVRFIMKAKCKQRERGSLNFSQLVSITDGDPLDGPHTMSLLQVLKKMFNFFVWIFLAYYQCWPLLGSLEWCPEFIPELSELLGKSTLKKNKREHLNWLRASLTTTPFHRMLLVRTLSSTNARLNSYKDF